MIGVRVPSDPCRWHASSPYAIQRRRYEQSMRADGRLKDLLINGDFIAHTSWPDTGDESVDLTERFRKVTRPMIAEVFDWDFVTRFWRQRELERSVEGVVAR